MNRKWLCFLSVIITLSLTSCLKDMEMKTARAGNKFLIDLPKNMTESTSIKPGADLQFTGDKEFPIYFYALTDEKSTQKTMGINFTSEELYFLEAEEISAAGQNVKITRPKSSAIQYLSCMRGEVFMNANSKDQIFKICVLEGGQRFYRLVIFGEAKMMKENTKAVDNIFESFREWTEFQVQNMQG